MSALPLILTTAGRDALINAQNTGVSNVVISQIGLASAQVALSAATAAIPGETKRLNLVGGTVVAPETFYVSGTDTSADTYTVRTVALYLDNGVLLGGYSQAAVLLEKAEPAMAVIEASIRLAEPLATSIEFTGGGWNNPPASESTEGVIRLATQLEVNAGANDKRAVTPKTLKALLTGLLAGFAPTNHTHDAAATTSGTFNEARIPDLGMARITGLVAALAGKASAAHVHVMADITGLVDALAAKANAAHTHAMADITGLVAALGGKAASVHAHVMADITGLVAALALKADLAGAAFTGATSAPQFGATGAGVGRAYLIKGTADNPGYASFQDVNGNERGFIGWRADIGGVPHSVVGGSWPWYFATRPKFGTDTPWDSGNFDPASKASLAGATFTGDVRGPTFIGGGLQARLGSGGYATLIPGNADFTGYVEFRTAADVRIGYIGFANKDSKIIEMTPENGGRFHFIGVRPLFAGATPWDSANLVVAEANTPSAAVQRDGAGGIHVQDVRAFRNNGTGVVYLGDNAHYLYFDGGAFFLANGQLSINGNWAWHDGNARSTAANFRSNGDDRALTPNNVWAAADPVAAAGGATIAINMAAGLNFVTVMTANRTLGAPSNAKPGQSGFVRLLQDGVGGRTLAFDPAWKFAGGTDPVLSTAANAQDVLVFTVLQPDFIVASLLKDVR